MPTYYETLKVEPTATPAEVTRACDDLYDQWRRLSTHHDPGTVAQANQALQQIEAIRATLSDPNQRRAYDASIGLGGVVAGLADPAALLRAAPPPPPPADRGASPSPARPANLWACPSCGAENPPHTRFCLQDGTQLVRPCPACGQMSSLVATGMCGDCGTSYDVGVRRTELQSSTNAAQAQLATEQAAHRSVVASVEDLRQKRLKQEATYGERYLWVIGIGIVGSIITAIVYMWGRPTNEGIIAIVPAGLTLYYVTLSIYKLRSASWRTFQAMDAEIEAAEREASRLQGVIDRAQLEVDKLQAEFNAIQPARA